MTKLSPFPLLWHCKFSLQTWLRETHPQDNGFKDQFLYLGLMIDDVNRSTAFAGSYVSVVLVNIDVESICIGHVLCDVQHPIPVSNRFEAKIVLFDIIYPITKGYPVSNIFAFTIFCQTRAKSRFPCRLRCIFSAWSIQWLSRN